MDIGRFAVFELEAPVTVDPAEFLSMGKATPFEGERLLGRCMLTVSAGKTAYSYRKD